MVNEMHKSERPTCFPAGGASLCMEAWQSGLLHRAYLPADVWVSKPLLTSRGFETHRFHHPISGTDAAATASIPITSPGDEPVANDHLDYIRPARPHFQSRTEPSLQMKDELHERTFPR